MTVRLPPRRVLIAVAATLVVLAPVGWFWQQSLLPDGMSPMSMGYADYGGGPSMAGMHAGHGRDLSKLVAPADRPADVSVKLVARKERFDIPGRGPMKGYTLNHTSPGPTIKAKQGDLVEVTLVNESIPDGITLHGTVSTYRLQRTGSRVSRRMLSLRGRPSCTASSRPTWARTGTTRTRCRMSRSRRACSVPW